MPVQTQDKCVILCATCTNTARLLYALVTLTYVQHVLARSIALVQSAACDKRILPSLAIHFGAYFVHSLNSRSSLLQMT